MRTVIGYITTFAENSSPAQGGVLESDFLTPEVLSFYNGPVGNAVSSSDWVTCIWEGRCGN